MARPQRDNHAAARALADWSRYAYARSRETEIATTHGVSTTTLWRWKKALASDSELAALFRDATGRIATGDWASHLTDALIETVAKLRRLIDASNDLPAVTEAFVALSDVALEKEMLRAALEAEQADGAVPAGASHHRDHAGIGPN